MLLLPKNFEEAAPILLGQEPILVGGEGCAIIKGKGECFGCPSELGCWKLYLWSVLAQAKCEGIRRSNGFLEESWKELVAASTVEELRKSFRDPHWEDLSRWILEAARRHQLLPIGVNGSE